MKSVNPKPDLAVLRKAWYTETNPAVRARRAEQYIGAMEAQLLFEPTVRKAQGKRTQLPPLADVKAKLTPAMQVVFEEVAAACVGWSDALEASTGLDIYALSEGGPEERKLGGQIQEWVIDELCESVKENAQIVLF